MVSQSSGRQDSPVDPWERVSNYGGSIDGLPSLLDSDHPPCQSDIRATRHKAAWINPPCVQQQLQDLPLRVPTMGNSGSHFVGHAASPLGPSPSSLEDSMMGTISSKPTVGSMGSSGAVKVSGRSSSLSSFSPEAFVLPVDVEKENAHFYAADLMISAIEKMKCNILSQQYMENWNTEEASGSLGNDQADSEVTFYTNITQESGSSTSSDSGYEGKWGCAVLQVSPVVQTPIYCDVVKECKCDLDEFVVVELGEFNNITETCGCPCSSSKSVTYEPNFNSAELIAKELYRVFRKCWMLSQVNYQLAGSLSAAGSIVVNEECLRQDFESSVDIVKEIKFKSRLRGTKDWTPPRFQVIVDVHPPLKRDLVVAAQNFFCAGCGTQIEPKFARRLRYCEYLGKYFCDCCHSHSESCIPARILTMWDFRKYYVSNFSKRLLDSIWHQPIFNLRNVNYSLYAKAKELGRVREIQEQLFQIKKMLKTCRFAESTLKEFEQMPRHLTDELHLFSLEDLVRVKKGLLVSSLKDVLKASLEHVACCELCQGKGFICEFCRSTTVIFPFQTATCRRCSACRACFHKQCFQSAECPRCARITARRRLASLLSAAT
ncbi:protein associated with UVRAG as autophagy enhancer isoform X3 [Rhinolophus ferrumequinum]|uniref:protein associated with UVRAG as autophagy enhancer isoform X3 n=1 Tax=Rhinolophus ferrumequinum TaxID=59479 RepID=UPI00140FAA55|nr:protein associated with UVRAG as autophagy enhancer isoform X3 [Rhinolophus ferrumequinum]